MFRALLVSVGLIAAIWGISGHHAAAQSGAGGAPAPIVLILHKNPLLAELNRVSASDLERIVKQLNSLRMGLVPRVPVPAVDHPRRKRSANCRQSAVCDRIPAIS